MPRGLDVFVQWVDEAVKAYEARQAMLAELAARALATAELEHSPATIAHWSCQKPTEVLKPFEIVVPDWRPRVEAFAMQDSLLDRYRFPFL